MFKFIISVLLLVTQFAFAEDPQPEEYTCSSFRLNNHTLGLNKIFSDSGIYGPKYNELIQSLENESLKSQVKVEKIVYGTSMGGRELTTFKLQLKQSKNPDVVIITGATHGNEYLNIADALMYNFINVPSVKLQEFLLNGGIVYFTPVFNPDGYDGRSRYNNNRKDLNRDFSLIEAKHTGFLEAETNQWESFLATEMTGKNLRVVMDYHCCDGSLLFPWAFTMRSIPADDLAVFKTVGEIMKSEFPSYRYGSTGAILGYTPKGTSKDYYYETFGALAFTFEGARGKEDKKIAQHIKMWNQIFDFLRVEQELLLTENLN